jgi:serine/threonine protein kinase/class 3 adenylate cyclase/formylglycine-generating enzyme required for sulfatase activity/dienelactone hydrolase
MDPQTALQYREQVEQFRRKFRTGLVTLVFTDLVGSTRLKQTLGEREGVALIQHHHAVVRELLSQFKEGEEISTAGDSFFIVFVKPSDAVRFALLLQARIRALAEASPHPLQDRIGIHIGEVVIEDREGGGRPRDLYGSQVDLAARVMSLAAGDQVLLTRATFDNARQVLKGEELQGLKELNWLNHGPYLLAGLEDPVEICEVGEASLAHLKPPPDAPKARRQVSPDSEPVLGWRPAVGQPVPNTRWTLEKKLGEGGFGEVWLGRHQHTKEGRVFKFCFRADRVRFLKREMTLFRLLKERVGDHPNIVRLHDVYLEQPPYYVEMDYVEGHDLRTWADARGGVGNVPLEARIEIVAQVADALQAAHEAGVIHRDVKPTNILISAVAANWRSPPPAPAPSLPSSPSDVEREQEKVAANASSPLQVRAKLTDFGIGQVVSEEYLKGVTRAGFTQTMMSDSSTSHTGTQLYMAPELLAGTPASTRSDIYSLGVVLFQLLVGDLRRPLTTDWAKDIPDPLLREDLARCFAGRPEERFASAGMLAKSLRSLDQRQSALAEQQAAAAARHEAMRLWKRVGSIGVASLVLGLAGSLIWFSTRGAKVRWAREIALPEITRLGKEGKNSEAFALAEQAEKYIPNDPALTNLWPQISVRALIETTPSAADVYLKEYRKPESAWRYLGQSPLRNFRLPRSFYRWQIKKEGYLPSEKAWWALPDPQLPWAGATNSFFLFPADIPEGMVRVPGGQSRLLLTGLDPTLDQLALEDYLIDKHEVSNRRFKEFVDRGGYQNTSYWKQPFVVQGRSLSWTDALAEFRDTTGHAGPATWKNGTYPDGQANHPVAGISWYEAAAYAEFAGKRLLSLYHWNRAAGLGLSEFIVPFSNFAGRGPAPVGSYQGMSEWGAYDMAGNVKEWCWNEAHDGKRYILGGAWSEPQYMFHAPDAVSPWDRSATHGFRCMRLLSTNALAKGVDAPVSPAFRDYAKEEPVTDGEFQGYTRLFIYDKTDLDARIEAVDDTSELWRKEKVSFTAAYANERVTAYLFLPKKFPPPYQTVVYFPGSGDIHQASSDNLNLPLPFLIENGRALMYPIYKGTYERRDGLRTERPLPTVFYRDHVVQWSKDLGRAIDYLETRQDIQADKLAYCGFSWGAVLGAVLPALESRLKTSVLVGGGFFFQTTLPEVDQINFAPRVTQPTLMLNGRYDFIFPVETSQRHMFRLLGTPPERKLHRIFDSGHGVPREKLVPEVLAWLDRYLGPVK